MNDMMILANLLTRSTYATSIIHVLTLESFSYCHQMLAYSFLQVYRRGTHTHFLQLSDGQVLLTANVNYRVGSLTMQADLLLDSADNLRQGTVSSENSILSLRTGQL
jgi:hypothetical protein